MIYEFFLDELAYTGDAAILGSLKENILVTFVLPLCLMRFERVAT